VKPAALWMFQFVFGCHHAKLSRAFTIKKRTYKICFECGHEFDYSWALMHPVQANVPASTCVPTGRVSQAEVSVI